MIDRDTVDIEQPRIFANRVCNALKADPRSVDLRAQSTHFYAFAIKFLEWTEREDLLEIIIDTFRSRIAKLADHAHNPSGALSEGMEFLKGLDETERARKSLVRFKGDELLISPVFKAGHDSATQARKWSERPRDT